MSGLKLEAKKPDTGAVLKAMALRALALIRERAFPPASGVSGDPTRSVTGVPAKPLTKAYARAKAERLLGGTTKAGKWKKASVKAGFNVSEQRSAVDTGLAAAPPNQQLTMQTAKALGILRASSTEVVIGFSNEDARMRAISLQKRNNFWPMSQTETKATLDIAREAGHKWAKSVKVKGESIRIEL